MTSTKEQVEAANKSVEKYRHLDWPGGKERAALCHAAPILADALAAKDAEIAELELRLHALEVTGIREIPAAKALIDRAESAEDALATALDERQEDQSRFLKSEASLAAVTKERDLAIAHDRQPYPTAEAYEKVCDLLKQARFDLDSGFMQGSYARLKHLQECEAQLSALRLPPSDEEEREALRVADVAARWKEVPGALTKIESGAFEVLARALRSKTQALLKEHEVALTWHRQNMEIAARNVELSSALKESEEKRDFLSKQLDYMARCYACSRLSNSSRSQCFDCWKSIELSRNNAEARLAESEARGAVKFMEAEYLDGRGCPKGWETPMIHLLEKAKYKLADLGVERLEGMENNK